MQSLQPFHTFNIPANAREIIEATSIEQIQQAWQKAQAENLPVLFLGQGSNMLFLEDFQGMVIINRLSGIQLSLIHIFGGIGLLLYGLGTALYLTCHQGAGPRDGLMVGLCQRFHLKVGIVRTSLEVSVCVLGYILGGTVGIGTVVSVSYTHLNLKHRSYQVRN